MVKDSHDPRHFEKGEKGPKWHHVQKDKYISMKHKGLKKQDIHIANTYIRFCKMAKKNLGKTNSRSEQDFISTIYIHRQKAKVCTTTFQNSK